MYLTNANIRYKETASVTSSLVVTVGHQRRFDWKSICSLLIWKKCLILVTFLMSLWSQQSLTKWQKKHNYKLNKTNLKKNPTFLLLLRRASLFLRFMLTSSSLEVKFKDVCSWWSCLYMSNLTGNRIIQFP